MRNAATKQAGKGGRKRGIPHRHDNYGLPVHPGGFLKEELKARSLSATEFADALGVSRSCILAILNKRSGITADTALRLARYFGNSAQFWINYQSQYELALAAQTSGAEIKRRVRPADEAG